MSKQKSSKLSKVCPGCGKVFECYPSQNYTHCSIKCRSKAAKVSTICPTCGKEFEYNRGWPRKYCSRKCQMKDTVSNFGKYSIPIESPIYCEQCGEEITKNRHRKCRFCSQKCFGKWQSENVCGENHPAYGKKAKPRPLKGKMLVCLQCGKEFYCKPSHVKRRRFCSRKCHVAHQREASHLVSGSNNFNWKGGYEPYYGPSWPKQRRLARQRDDYICRECGITETELGHELDVHHIVPFREFGRQRHEEANVLSNLISLCNICHLAVEPRRTAK